MNRDAALGQPLLGTDSITMKHLQPADAPRLQEIFNHRDLRGRRYLPDWVNEYAPLSPSHFERVLQEWGEAREALHMGIQSLEPEQLVGVASCDWSWDPHSPNVSVVVEPAHQRQGLGSEALSALLRHLYDYTPAHNVSCWIADWNDPALAFAHAAGFRDAGRVRHAGLRGRSTYDYVVLDLLRPEWVAASGES